MRNPTNKRIQWDDLKAAPDSRRYAYRRTQMSTSTKANESHHVISIWQIAMLCYLPKNAAGWIFHTLFYIALGICVLLTGWIIYGTVVYGNPGTSPLHWITLAYGPLVIAFVLAYALFWIPARFIAKSCQTVQIEGQSSADESTETSTA